MLVTIRRQKDADSSPYWQSFEYELKGRETVAGILEKLNFQPYVICVWTEVSYLRALRKRESIWGIRQVQMLRSLICNTLVPSALSVGFV